MTVDGDKSVTAHFKPITYGLHLRSGWNLISLPLIPNSADIEDVLAGIMDNVACVWTYDNAMGRWAYYAPGTPSDLTEMTCGNGYWVKVTDPCTLVIVGREPPLPRGIPLGSGWNLVGLPLAGEPQPVEDVFATIMDNIACIWTYDEGWAFCAPGAPSDLTEMTDGKGYWVRVTDSCTLSVEGS